MDTRMDTQMDTSMDTRMDTTMDTRRTYDTKYITVVLHSGLGNRLFQWAGAAYQAKLTHRTLILVDDFVGPNVHDSKLHSYFCEIVRPLRKKNAPGSLKFVTGIPTDSQLHSKQDTIVLFGYFFDAKQAPALEEIVRPYLESVVQRKTFRWTHSMVHVRLNDYRGGLNLFNAYDTPIRKYYARAWQRAQEDPSQVYEIQSDEPEKALDWLPSGLKQQRLMPKMGLQETFESMITCNGGIATNSTFSWWALQFQQWLSVDFIAKYQYVSSWTLQRKKPAQMPKPWARLQDLAHWTSPITRCHPITDAIQPEWATLVSYPSHNWTFLEAHLIVGLVLGAAMVLTGLFTQDAREKMS